MGGKIYMILRFLSDLFLRKRKPSLAQRGGVEKDIFDERDYIVEGIGLPLPNSFSLRDHVKEIKSQGKFNSCVSHAVCSAIEISMHYKNPNTYISLSERYHYYYGRKESGLFPGNNGQYPRDALKALFNKGVAPEFLCGYYDDSIDSKPLKIADIIAHTYKQRLDKYQRLYAIEDMKEQILIGNPIIISLPFYDYMIKTGKNNVIRMPTKDDTLRFYHAVLVTGWDENKGWEILNSWNSTWGDYGYAYLPFKCSINDRWVIKLK